MSLVNSATTASINILINYIETLSSRLVQEKNLIKKEKARKQKIDQYVYERSIEWESLLEEQEGLKSIYVRARNELQEEEGKLDNVKTNLTRYRGQLNKITKLAKRKKKICSQS